MNFVRKNNLLRVPIHSLRSLTARSEVEFRSPHRYLNKTSRNGSKQRAGRTERQIAFTDFTQSLSRKLSTG